MNARGAAIESAVRCYEQRVRGHHSLGLAEIHRIYAGEYQLSSVGRKQLAAALEHASKGTAAA